MKNALKRTLFMFLFVAPSTLLAATWDEQHAFCYGASSHMLNISQYEYQKSYNKCMKNADTLIADYENRKEEIAKQTLLYWEEEEKRTQERLKIQRQQMIEVEVEREREAKEKEQEEKKIDDLFGEF
jgi:hypothetical protein